MTHARRTDANHAAIRDALRQIGAFVQDLSRVGEGCPDLLCGHRGRWIVIEVKDGKKCPSERRLTPDQERWHGLAQELGLPCFVVTDINSAIEALNKVP